MNDDGPAATPLHTTTANGQDDGGDVQTSTIISGGAFCFVVRIANLTTAEIATNNYEAQLGTKFRKIGAEGGQARSEKNQNYM